MRKGKIAKSAFYYKRRATIFAVFTTFFSIFAGISIICVAVYGIAIFGVFGILSVGGIVVFAVLVLRSKRVVCSLCGSEIRPRDAQGFADRAYCRCCIGRVIRVADNAEQALGALYASGFAPTRSFAADSLFGVEIPSELRSERNVFRMYIDDAGGKFCLTASNGGREYLLNVYDKKDVCGVTMSSSAETRLREEKRMNVGCIVAGFLLGGIIWGLIALAVRETVHVPYVVYHHVADIYTDGSNVPVRVKCGSAEEAGSLCAAFGRGEPPIAAAGAESPPGGNKIIDK